MEDFRLLIAIGVCAVYIGATTLNASFIGQKYYLVLLADRRHYLVHAVLVVLLAGFGIWRVRQGSVREILYAGPLIFLLLLKILNWCIVKVYGRYLMIASQYDEAPADPEFRPRLLDRIALCLLILLPLLVPFLLLRFIR